MSRRISILLTLLGVMLIAALLPAASFADPANPPPQPISYSSTGLNPPVRLANANGRLTVMVELGTPAAIAAPNAPSSIIARQQIAAAQAALMPQLASLSARVLFQTSMAYAGVAVTIPADQLDRLRALPGIVRVTVIPPKLPSDVVPSTRAGAQPIAAAIAATGQGLRIGMIDRGIDYTHADFGGPGTPLAYSANDPNIIEPGSFPTAKVDGFDFAGDNYDASADIGSDTPVPDSDPLECMQPDAHAGRGTNAAGLAAGLGVAADGTPYRGPYGPGVDLSTLRIAPGVAPEAQLYSLKVFGCYGSSALLTQAIDRAVDPNGDGSSADHLDVLVISLGTPFGSDEDPDAIAVNNAVRAGVVVVVAAGDNLETFYAVDSPASASLAIAVGATDASGTIAAFSARGPQRGNHALKVDIAAPGVNLRS
nr:S8 family serine peptidase [Chloroflexota bacterium]